MAAPNKFAALEGMLAKKPVIQMPTPMKAGNKNMQVKAKAGKK